MHRLSIIILVLLAIGFSACEKKEEPKENTSEQAAMPAENMHKVVVLDYMNASNYTYLKVKENDSEYWLPPQPM